MSYIYLVAVEAIDFIVRPIDKVGGIQLVLAFDAGEALFVVRSCLGHLLLRLEDTATTSGYKDEGVHCIL